MLKNIFQLKEVNFSKQVESDNINFKVKYGEVHALIIEKALVKNKLLQLLSGIKTKISGQIIFNNKIQNKSLREIDSLEILPQEPYLMENFTVAENLTFDSYPGRGFCINWIEVFKRAQNLLDELNINIDCESKIFELDSKARKNIAIAKVFVRNPEMIIMHEPTENLEPENVHNLYNIIKKYKQQNHSVLYITRQWEEVLKIADRISVLSEGIIKGPVSADEIKKEPKVLLNLMGNYKYKVHNGKESNEVLDAVFKAAEYLTSEYELKDVLLLLAKQAAKTMNADGCIVNLIDEETNAIIERLEYNKNDELVARLKKESILQFVEDKEIYYANKRNKEYSSLFKEVRQVKTIICVPVLIRSQVTGLIQILYSDYYVYSEEEFKYLSTFARQAALAIEDTRLMGRSALLQESHHRIKNNLQSIISLLDIQKESLIEQPQVSIENVLESITARIKSIAAVHDLLSKNKSGRSIINIKNLINVIVDFVNFDNNIDFKLNLENIFIPYNKAASIALIINELIINCLKHAFPNNNGGIINIKCIKNEEEILFIIKDNGVGVPTDFNFEKVQSLGLSIVKSIIVNEIKGDLEFIKDNGLTVKIILPAENLFIGSEK